MGISWANVQFTIQIKFLWLTIICNNKEENCKTLNSGNVLYYKRTTENEENQGGVGFNINKNIERKI